MLSVSAILTAALIIALIAAAYYGLFVRLFPLPDPFNKIVLVLAVIACAVIALNALGILKLLK